MALNCVCSLRHTSVCRNNWTVNDTSSCAVANASCVHNTSNCWMLRVIVIAGASYITTKRHSFKSCFLYECWLTVFHSVFLYMTWLDNLFMTKCPACQWLNSVKERDLIEDCARWTLVVAEKCPTNTALTSLLWLLMYICICEHNILYHILEQNQSCHSSVISEHTRKQQFQRDQAKLGCHREVPVPNFAVTLTTN